MLRLAHKLVKPQTLLSSRAPSWTQRLRWYGSSSCCSPVALQMINYALSLAGTNNKSTDSSYSQALLVLEQCLSSNVSGDGDDSTTTKAIVHLAISTLLSQRGDFDDAMEKLEGIQAFPNSSLGVGVAAAEGLIGLNLEMGQDVTSGKLADKSLELWKSNTKDTGEFEFFQARVKAIKGLTELVFGNIENAGTCFDGAKEDKCCSGNVMLSHGEFLHATGKFALAKEYYNKAIQVAQDTGSFTDLHSLTACNMVPFEVLLGSTCALGQLEVHSRNFSDAEEILTRALTKAEEHFGSNHPKVGVILTCIALMFRYKAKMEHSSSILIQEGLYRKAIDILKAPSMESEGAEVQVQRRDVVALARGGYAEILSVQQNRKAEGERMKNWAESTWRNRRLSLAEALDISESSSQVAVIDTRISRVL